MEYFFERVPERAVCSDPSCPCDDTAIASGEGYLYVSPELVDFRSDALTEEALVAKIDAIERKTKRLQIFGPGVATPLLMCELGARRRSLDMRVAQEDARLWWQSGKVPLRATPLTAGAPRPASQAPAPKVDRVGSVLNVITFLVVAFFIGGAIIKACFMRH